MRKLRRPRQAPTKTNRNKNAIVTLSKQVRSLQNRSLGEYQRNIQWCHLEGATLPKSNSPCLFLLEGLYNNSHVMKGTLSAAGVPGFAENAVFQNTLDQTDIQSSFSWQTRENDDVSSICFKPIFSRINFTIRTSWHGQWPQPGNIRITILRIKPWLQTSKLDVSLPATLGAYRFLAQRSPDRSYFCSDYHQVLLDKIIPFNPDKTSNTTDCNQVIKTVSIPWKFGQSQVCRPDFTGDPGERMWSNTPETSQTWCLISVDSNLDAALTKMEIGRVNSWRDQHGTT